MNKKIKSFIIILLIILALGVIGYFKAMPGAGQEDLRPQIQIISDSYDFGEAQYGEILKHVFKVKNTGQEILEIKKIATSCGCTTAEVNKTMISPGEEADLNVEYNTGLMSGSHAKGSQERIIYIKTNDPINPQTEAIIKAYVR